MCQRIDAAGNCSQQRGFRRMDLQGLPVQAYLVDQDIPYWRMDECSECKRVDRERKADMEPSNERRGSGRGGSAGQKRKGDSDSNLEQKAKKRRIDDRSGTMR